MKKYFLFCFLSWAISTSLLAQVAGDYRSAASGDWDVAATWETYNGATWGAAAASPDFNNGAINILAGHTVTVQSGVNITTDETIVEVGGVLLVTLGGVFVINDGATPDDLTADGSISIDGTLRKNQGANVNSTMATLSVNGGGVYEHNNTVSIGNIPIATWQVGSECRIVGYTTIAGGVFPTNNFAQAFHHFTWDCVGQTTNPNLVGLLTTVNGNFSVYSTGTGSLRLWGNANSSTLTVGGNFSLYNGTVYTNFGIATPTLNLYGQFIMDNCTFGSSGAGSTTINFAALGQQQIDINTPTVTQTGNLQYFVRNSGGMGPSVLDFINPITEISSDSANSSFTLESGTGMYITHAGGIALTGNTGCVQVNTRTFDSFAGYTYIAGTPQVTGTGLPALITGFLDIENSTPFLLGGVTLTQATFISGPFSTFFSWAGKLITTPLTMLTLDTDCTLSHNQYIAFVEGPMQWNTNSVIEYYFPLGDIDRYMPMAMVPQNANPSLYICTAHYAAPANPNALSAAVCSVSNVEYWDITGTNPAQIKLYWDAISGIDETALQICNKLVVAHYDGATNLWESKGNSATDFVNDFMFSGTYNGNFITEAHTFGLACGLTAMATVSQPSCGTTNGAIDVMIMNGSGSYTYSWDDGTVTEDRSNITAGTYTLYVEESLGGCGDTLAVVLTSTGGVQATATTVNNVTCAGNDGSATITASGGSGTYLYSWEPTYYNTATVMGLSTGNYTVYVKDAADSTACVDTIGIFIGGYAAIGIAINDTFTLCNPAASVLLNVLANDIGILNNASLISLNSPAAGTLVNNGNGTFSFTLNVGFSGTTSFDYQIADTFGCTSTANVLINATSIPVPTISANGATTFCQGGNVILTSSASTGNLWSTGDTTQSITVTTSGNYSLTITVGTCSVSSAVTAVTVSPFPPIPTISANGATTFCQGGNVILTSSSATGNVWSTTATTQSITVSAAGTYTVTVTNAGGCSATSAPTTVIVNPLPTAPTITLSGSSAFCQGGSVNLTSSYLAGNTWSNGSMSNTINVTTSGSYTVTYTDANGCSASATPTVITVSPLPPTPIITTNGGTTFCQGGNVILTSSSPTGNVWSTTATTQSITVSAAGTYTVTVTNAGGCSATSAPTTVIINPLPSAPTISLNGNNVFCQGGSVDLISSYLSGNTWSNFSPNNTITVTTSGSYTVTYTDANGCSATSTPAVITVNPAPATPIISASGPTTFCQGDNVVLISSVATGNLWSNSANTQAITVATAGTFTVTVTDANGCMATSAPITTIVNPLPPTPTITINGNAAICQGQSVSLSSSAISGNVWSSGQNTQTISVDSAGTYTVTVTQNGCSATSAPINISVNPLPAAPTITVNGTMPICAGANIGLSSSQPTGNLWTTGQTNQTITVGAGTYAVTYTDANGCAVPSAPVTVTALAPITIATTVLSNSDCGAPIGSASAFASGGSGNFTYTWNSIPPQIAATATGLVGGVYTVTVADASNTSCTNTANVTITGGTVPNVALSVSGNVTACENKPIAVIASGAAAYTWLYNGVVVATGALYSISQTGVYQVIGFSNGAGTGCSDTSEIITLTIIPDPRAEVFPIGALEVCPEQEVILTAQAGTDATYIWLLNNQATLYTEDTISVSVSGYYSVVATNFCGKDTSAAVYVNIHTHPIADFVYEPIPAKVGEIVTFTDKSISAATWSWYFGDTLGNSLLQNPLYTYNAAGSYEVTMYIGDNIGCKDTMSHMVLVVAAGGNEIGFIPNVFSPNGDGEFDTFEILYGGTKLVSLTIFDRWGVKVFETTDASKTWDGTRKGRECAAGVYYYVIEATNQEGTKIVNKGSLTLLR